MFLTKGPVSYLSPSAVELEIRPADVLRPLRHETGGGCFCPTTEVGRRSGKGLSRVESRCPKEEMCKNNILL